MAVDKYRMTPEGGWGWVVVAGFALSNMINIPVLQGFALLFRQTFVELELATIDISTIINVNSSFGFLLGLFNGPLLKTFGYRKVCLFATALLFFGLLLTSRAVTFTEFIIYYGLMYSAGLVICISAFSLAVNSYFVKRRNRASGICMTATGLGPVFMPLMISKLMDEYGERGTGLILSALSLHTLAAAFLLQPVKWHYRKPEVESAEEGEKLNEAGTESMKRKTKRKSEKNLVEYNELDACPTSLGVEPSMVPRRFSDAAVLGRSGRGKSVSLPYIDTGRLVEPDPCWWSKSLHQITTSPGVSNSPDKNGVLGGDYSHDEKTGPETEIEVRRKRKWYQVLADIFDLDLLKDSGYRIIWLGMSIAFTAEINFSLMTPIILGDRGFDVDQTAKIMSVIGVADLVFRFVSPFVGERLNITARYMYTWSIFMLVVFRAGLTLVESYWSTIAVCAGLGVAKGFRTVYMTLVIPNYVSLEKLASASGLQTVLNGVLLMCFGPLLGYIRDASGSYDLCIHAMNLLSVTTIVMWTVEYLVVIRNSDVNSPDRMDVDLQHRKT